MDLYKAQTLANELMQKHGIKQQGWRFTFDNARRRFGCCKYRAKVITLSKYLTHLNDEKEVRNTILHEIAHALVGVGHGHDSVWKRKALEIGCDGKRCYTTENTNIVKGKWQATCPKCGYVHNKHRKPKRQKSCGNCSNVFDKERLLDFNLVD